MNIDLSFQNWQLSIPRARVQQYDDGAQVITVTGERPADWRWQLSVSVYGRAYFNAIPLTESADGTLTAVLTRDDLAFGDAVYTLQLVGERMGVTRHTNPVRLFVGASICGDGVWPEVPSSFTAAQRAAEAAAAVAEAAADAAASSADEAEASAASIGADYAALEDDVEALAADISLKLDAADAPAKTSDLQNDSGFITLAQVPAAPVQSVNGKTGAVTLKTSDLTNDAGYIRAAQAPVQSVNGRTGAVTVREVPDASGAAAGQVLTKTADGLGWASVSSGGGTMLQTLQMHYDSVTGDLSFSNTAYQTAESIRQALYSGNIGTVTFTDVATDKVYPLYSVSSVAVIFARVEQGYLKQVRVTGYQDMPAFYDTALISIPNAENNAFGGGGGE